jgi:hypothetical protein
LIFDFGWRLGGIVALQLAEAGDGGAIVFRVFELAVERARPGGPGGVELRQVADEDDELGGD